MKSHRLPPILLLICITGAAGLIAETSWQQYLTVLLGSGAKSTALTLCVFFASLGFGYRLFGELARRRDSSELIRLTAIVEICIGLWVPIFLLLHKLGLSILPFSPAGVISSFFFDLTLVFALISVPASLMGATLPLLTQSLSGSLSSSSYIHSRIYAWNTVGAFLGCVLSGVVLHHTIGLLASLCFAGLLNILAGILLLRYAKRVLEGEETHLERIPEDEVPSTDRRLILGSGTLLLAVLAGFCAFTLQTLLVRVFAFAMGPSGASFAMVVGAYILALALGAWFIIRPSGNRLSLLHNQWFAFLCLVLLFLLCPYLPYLTHLLRIQFDSSVSPYSVYLTGLFVFVLLLILLPVGAMGATMPLIFDRLTKTKHLLGVAVGRIYLWNTIGSVAGALLGGYFAFYIFDVAEVFLICLLGLGITIVIAATLAHRRASVFWGNTALVVLVLGVAFLYEWNPKYLSIGLFREKAPLPFSYDGPVAFYGQFKEVKVLSHDDDPIASISVLEFPDSGRGLSRSILVNGKPDGNTLDDRQTMNLLGHLPALLQPGDGKRAAVIGFGTGMTAGALSMHSRFEHIDVVEIAPSMKRLASFFGRWNGDVHLDSRVRWNIADAFKFFGSGKELFDVIVSQPSNPWMAGTERLYTREFYQRIKASLKEKGIFAQWLSLYGLSPETIQIIVRTLAESFPHSRMFQSGRDVIVLAANTEIAGSSLQYMAQRLAESRVKSHLASLGFSSPLELLLKEQWLPGSLFSHDVVHTIRNPVVGKLASLDFYYDVTTDPTELVQSRLDEFLVARSSYDSLASYWLKSEKNTPPPALLLQAACGGTQVALIEPVWRTFRTPCRDSIVNYLLRGENETPKHLESELRWLKNYYNRNLPEKASLDEAVRDVKYFELFHSPFLPLDPSLLMSRTSLCRTGFSPEALHCHSQLTQVLARTGHANAARQQLALFQNRASHSVSRREMAALEWYVNGA